MLAIRDEDPDRPWSPLGRWWPESHGGVVGVRDLRAGGAWLAADSDAGRLAVLLNRADVSTLAESEIVSRGSLALDSVAGHTLKKPRTHGFNLVEVEGSPDARFVLGREATHGRTTEPRHPHDRS